MIKATLKSSNRQKWHTLISKYALMNKMYGAPSVSKILTNAILVYLPLIYKYDIDLSKYLPDLYMWAGYNISDLDL